MSKRVQKYEPLTISRKQYRREHHAFGSELFYRCPSTFRCDVETRLAALPGAWGRGYEEVAGFYSFIWRNAAAFIDIAGEFTRRLRGAERIRALWLILCAAWRARHKYEPTAIGARLWFRRVCLVALEM